MELSPPGSSAHGILQAGTVQWIAFPCPGTFPDPDIKPESPAQVAQWVEKPPAMQETWVQSLGQEDPL